MDNDNLNAVLNGLNLGKLALSGLQPQVSSPRGGPPPVDPLADKFRQCLSCLNDLAQQLQKQGDARNMLEAQEMYVELQRMSIDRQDEIQKKAADSMMQGPGGGEQPFGAQFPNVNGGGIV